MWLGQATHSMDDEDHLGNPGIFKILRASQRRVNIMAEAGDHMELLYVNTGTAIEARMKH